MHAAALTIPRARRVIPIAYFGPIIDGAHDIIRDALDRLDESKQKLIVVLETYGGTAEAAERLQRLFRHDHEVVEFIVPGYAMSAGTVLVMSGDAIWMDYSSILGPIDPQVVREGGRSVPALGYIEKYEALMAKAASPVGLNTAELMYLVQSFDPADISDYEHARDLAIALLTDWLVQSKFKNWSVTATSKTPVTQDMKEQRAEEIAKELNNTARWNSHGRGIPMDVLVKDLNLRIDDLESNDDLGVAVRQYYSLLKDYMLRRGTRLFGTRGGVTMDSDSTSARATDEQVRANPNVNESQLRDAERAVRALREQGIGPPRPTVRSPYGQRLSSGSGGSPRA